MDPDNDFASVETTRPLLAPSDAEARRYRERQDSSGSTTSLKTMRRMAKAKELIQERGGREAFIEENEGLGGGIRAIYRELASDPARVEVCDRVAVDPDESFDYAGQNTTDLQGYREGEAEVNGTTYLISEPRTVLSGVALSHAKEPAAVLSAALSELVVEPDPFDLDHDDRVRLAVGALQWLGYDDLYDDIPPVAEMAEEAAATWRLNDGGLGPESSSPMPPGTPAEPERSSIKSEWAEADDASDSVDGGESAESKLEGPPEEWTMQEGEVRLGSVRFHVAEPREVEDRLALIVATDMESWVESVLDTVVEAPETKDLAPWHQVLLAEACMDWIGVEQLFAELHDAGEDALIRQALNF